MTTKKETTLRQRIIKRLRAEEGGFWTHVHGNPFTPTGLPDIMGCWNGRFVGFEVKLPENPRGLTDKQKYTLEQISAAGGIAAEIRSFDEAKTVLDSERAAMSGRGDEP